MPEGVSPSALKWCEAPRGASQWRWIAKTQDSGFNVCFIIKISENTLGMMKGAIRDHMPVVVWNGGINCLGLLR